MRQYKVAHRYAKALYTLAVENGKLDQVREDIETIRAIDHEDFRRIILSPVISGDKKAQLFESVFGGKISQLTKSFFNLVFEKGRVTALTEIRAAFVELYREDKGIKTLHFTSAIPVSQDVKEDILRRMQSMPRYQKYTLILEEKIDETIIGGFVLQIEDELFDASIRNDLDYIKKQFVENMYIQRIR